ncbi:glycosyltransferase [Candidatus Pacearchaeota archaeon]|nr:glycosyltransferase [Candidatus Pacearchaeota archaeon]
MSKLAIIIPAHNEERRIRRTLEEYSSYFAKLVKGKNLSKATIIVVLNACSDSTKDIVGTYHTRGVEMLEFERGGKGFAVIKGFKYALKNNYDYIGFVDADMSTMPGEFYRLFLKMKGYDGVIASRYLKGAMLDPPNTFARIIASRIYNFLIRIMLVIPYRDTQCGAKILKRKTVERVIYNMGMTQWAFDIEMLYLVHKRGFRVLEAATSWSNKDYSTINFWKSGLWMGLAIVRLRILNSPFKKMVRIYDKFIRVFKPAK